MTWIHCNPSIQRGFVILSPWQPLKWAAAPCPLSLCPHACLNCTFHGFRYQCRFLEQNWRCLVPVQKHCTHLQNKRHRFRLATSVRLNFFLPLKICSSLWWAFQPMILPLLEFLTTASWNIYLSIHFPFQATFVLVIQKKGINAVFLKLDTTTYW